MNYRTISMIYKTVGIALAGIWAVFDEPLWLMGLSIALLVIGWYLLDFHYWKVINERDE